MLSSTADHLYWMARSMERAENTARLLDVTYRMSLLKHSTLESAQEWSAVLSTSGLQAEFAERYNVVNQDNVIHFMTLDEGNPVSIYSSLHLARENARSVRGTITPEMWEAINQTWLQVSGVPKHGIAQDGISGFFEWVKGRSHLSRGISYGTLLRDDVFRFLRLGIFIERADNTARILDVKYHILLPGMEEVGGAADYYQWGALLRSVSAFVTYRRVYRDMITPRRVAELLILRADMPRSLHACIAEVNQLVEELNGPKSGDLIRLAGLLRAELRYAKIDDIIAQGLHEYLNDIISRIYALSDSINTTYFWAVE